MSIRLSVCLLALFSLGAFAQEFPHFNQWMKGTDQANGALRKLDKKVGPQAMRAAEMMGGVYEEMIGFFRQYGRQDAIKWSEEGKAAAAMLAAAAYKEDVQAAAAAYKSLSGTCTACHNQYREKTADGKFRFKQRP